VSCQPATVAASAPTVLMSHAVAHGGCGHRFGQFFDEEVHYQRMKLVSSPCLPSALCDKSLAHQPPAHRRDSPPTALLSDRVGLLSAPEPSPCFLTTYLFSTADLPLSKPSSTVGLHCVQVEEVAERGREMNFLSGCLTVTNMSLFIAALWGYAPRNPFFTFVAGHILAQSVRGRFWDTEKRVYDPPAGAVYLRLFGSIVILGATRTMRSNPNPNP
jgi:hypothetical protein